MHNSPVLVCVAKPHVVWYSLMIWSFSAKRCRLEHDFWPVLACVYLHSSTLLPLPSIWTLLHSSGLQRILPVCEQISVVLPSAVAFCCNLSLTVDWCEREEELREQNKIEIMLISPEKWITRKILTAKVTEVCIEGKWRDKRHRTCRGVVKTSLSLCTSHTWSCLALLDFRVMVGAVLQETCAESVWLEQGSNALG